jgi:ATP-dependent Clp protease ATP-binding subunit ClpA
VFDFIRPPADEAIVALLVKQLQHTLQAERGIEMALEASVVATLNRLARENLAFGGRGIRNVVDSALVNPLASWLFDNAIDGDAKFRLTECVDHGNDALQRFAIKVER